VGILNFVLVAVTLFGAYIFFVRWLTGWKTLEENYRCDRKIPNELISNGSYRWVSASLKDTKIVVVVEVYPDALWLCSTLPLTIIFKPLRIPWHSIESAELRSSFFGKKACLKIAGIKSPIYILGEAGQKICEAVQQSNASI
jgi:hypothetical protein